MTDIPARNGGEQMGAIKAMMGVITDQVKGINGRLDGIDDKVDEIKVDQARMAERLKAHCEEDNRNHNGPHGGNLGGIDPKALLGAGLTVGGIIGGIIAAVVK